MDVFSAIEDCTQTSVSMDVDCILPESGGILSSREKLHRERTLFEVANFLQVNVAHLLKQRGVSSQAVALCDELSLLLLRQREESPGLLHCAAQQALLNPVVGHIEEAHFLASLQQLCSCLLLWEREVHYGQSELHNMSTMFAPWRLLRWSRFEARVFIDIVCS